MKQNIIFGASVGGFEFLKAQNHTHTIDAFCDNDVNKVGKTFFGIPTISVKNLDPLHHYIFICSIFHCEIKKQLLLLGFAEDQLEVVHPKNIFRLTCRQQALDILTEATKIGIKYVVLRNYEDLFADEPFLGDIDILISDTDLQNFLQLLPKNTESNDGIKLDIYSTNGTQGYRFFNMPIFPIKLAYAILDLRQQFRGVNIPNPYMQYVSLMYYVLFYKGSEAKIPLISGELPSLTNDVMLSKPKTNYNRHTYLSDLNKYRDSVGSMPSLKSLFDIYLALKHEGFFPDFDIYRKTIVDNQIKQYIMDNDVNYLRIMTKAQSLGLYRPEKRYLLLFERESLYTNNLRAQYDRVLLNNTDKFDVIYSAKLSPTQRQTAKEHVRGGNWLDDWGSNLSGEPISITLIRNVDPKPLPHHKLTYFTFNLIDDTYFIKEKLREQMLSEFHKGPITNHFHSTDDDLELLLYAEQLNIDNLL
ncbi:hypothetical protein N8446_08760 [Planktomarina temperata]|nr:hypothetical protein [Planktomarina temperata]